MQDRLPQYLMEAYIEGSIVPNARAILRFVEEQSQREKILSPSTTDVYTETDLINKSDETLLRTVVTTVKNMTGSSGQEVRKGEFSSSFDGRQFNISYDDATRFGVWYTEEDDEPERLLERDD
jgi:site-specific DNA-adenine methylase